MKKGLEIRPLSYSEPQIVPPHSLCVHVCVPTHSYIYP